LAKEDIEPHQPIVGIPFECMVCVPNCLRNPQDRLGVILREMWLNQTIGGDGLLALCISREVKRGEASSFYPYLVFLIKTAEPGTISKWSDDEREDLQDGITSKRAEERNVSELRMHSRVVATVMRYAQQKDPESYLETSEALDDIPAELFVWSYHIIQARAFGRRLPWTSLVPLADCFNHANLPVRYALDTVGDGSVGGAKGCTTDPGEKAGTFTLFPSGDNRYSRGCEIFNSYGRRNNSHLLLDYGFAMFENEWETVNVRISLTKGEAPAEISAYEHRRAALRDLGYKSVRTVKLQRGYFVEDGLLMFRVANVDPDETDNGLQVRMDMSKKARPDSLAHCLPLTHSFRSSQYETLDLLRPLDKNVEIRALVGIMSVIREVGQGEWTTSIDEDEVRMGVRTLKAWRRQ
jgi:hypothetical protein